MDDHQSSSPDIEGLRRDVAAIITDGGWQNAPSIEIAADILLFLEARDALRSARSSAATAKPVAWRSRHKGSYYWDYTDEEPKGPSAHLFEVEPLFTLAQAAPERGNRFCKKFNCPYPDCLDGGICSSQPSTVSSTDGGGK